MGRSTSCKTGGAGYKRDHFDSTVLLANEGEAGGEEVPGEVPIVDEHAGSTESKRDTDGNTAANSVFVLAALTFA